MKSLLVLCLVAVAVYGLPAKKTDDDSEESFFLFPRMHKKQVPSVVEVEVGDSDEDTAFFPSYFRPLFVNPFSFMNFGFSDFFYKPFWFESLVPKGIPEDAVKNSTSSTKVIDGHKITVNETTYENEKNGAVYRFQIIDISPVDSKEKDEKPAAPDNTPDVSTEKDQTDSRTESAEEVVKPDQNSQDNEIHREEMFENYELQGDDPSVYRNPEVTNLGNSHPENHFVDLSGDTRVNSLLAENARRGGLFMVPPEVEVFDVLNYDSLSGNYQQQETVDDRQEIVRPQYNHQIVGPQDNQQVVRPQYNQQVVERSQYNQQVVRPQYNQQAVGPQDNHQVVGPQDNQQVVRPQDNQQAVGLQYNQQVVRPQYNQQVVRPQYNQQAVGPQYNHQVIGPQDNHQVVERPQYNQQQI